MQAQQPFSLLSEGEDFVVIDEASGTSSSQGTPSPQESANPACPQLSLLKGGSSESEVQQLAKQISEVSERNSSVRRSLSGNSGSLERLRGTMTGKLSELQRILTEKDAELAVKIEQCEKLQTANKNMKDELTKLKNKQGEWDQTFADYGKLKNEYNLMTCTKERLESEKADLLKKRDELVAAEVEKMREQFDAEQGVAMEAERAKCQEELEAERAKCNEELEALRRNHESACQELNLELAAVRKTCKTELTAAQSDGEKALSALREERQAELENLLSKHRDAMEAMRNDFDDQIRKQQRLTAEAKQELETANGKHEAEKSEMLDQLKLSNISSLPRPSDSGMSIHSDVGTEIGSSLCSNCRRITDIDGVRERPAVQEQGSVTFQETCSIGVTTSCVSVATSEASMNTEGPTLAVANAVVTTVAPPQQQPAVCQASEESQTDPLECQVANSDSLQKNSVTRNLQMQLATFAYSLATERKEKERLEDECKKLQQKCNQLSAVKSASSASQSATSAANRCSQLEKQLQEKQSELDSVMEDFDETRTKLYEFVSQVKDHQSRQKRLQKECDALRNQLSSAQSGSSSSVTTTGSADEDLKQKTCQLEKQLQEKQAELDSILKDFDETRTKLYGIMEQAKDHQSLQKRLQLQPKGDEPRNEMNPVKSASSASHSDSSAANMCSQLEKKLKEKQSELDSVMQDLDNTRTKLYELMEQVKDHQNSSTRGDTQTEMYRQKIRELESKMQIEKQMAEATENQQNMELDSIRKEGQFKDTKLQAAEKEVGQLRLEVQRLKNLEDELQKRCRENDETVKQVFATADQDKSRMEEELKNLKSENQAKTEVLQANVKSMEDKAAQEMKLRDTIHRLEQRLEKQANEHDDKLAEEKRKQERLYNKMCDQSEQRVVAEQKLRQANDKLTQAQQQIGVLNGRLEDSEKFASDMQNYSASQEEDIERLKHQQQESSKKRDEAIHVAEQMRAKLLDDRAKLQEQLQRSANLNSELSKLQLEHTKLRANYADMERSVPDMLAKEHELKTKLGLAEEAIDVFKGKLQVLQMEVDDLKNRNEVLRVERDTLQIRVNRLIEDLTEQERQPSSGIDLLDKHRTLRPPGSN